MNESNCEGVLYLVSLNFNNFGENGFNIMLDNIPEEDSVIMPIVVYKRTNMIDKSVNFHDLLTGIYIYNGINYMISPVQGLSYSSIRCLTTNEIINLSETLSKLTDKHRQQYTYKLKEILLSSNSYYHRYKKAIENIEKCTDFNSASLKPRF